MQPAPSTPLEPAIHAIKKGDLNTLKNYLNGPRKFQLVSRTLKGRTLLHMAARIRSRQQVAIIEALIAAGAKVNAEDAQGHTPLHWAAIRNCPEAIVALTAKGAVIEIKNKESETPLHVAARSNAFDSVEQLVRLGAAIFSVNHRGHTAGDIAHSRWGGEARISRYLDTCEYQASAHQAASTHRPPIVPERSPPHYEPMDLQPLYEPPYCSIPDSLPSSPRPEARTHSSAPILGTRQVPAIERPASAPPTSPADTLGLVAQIVLWIFCPLEYPIAGLAYLCGFKKPLRYLNHMLFPKSTDSAHSPIPSRKFEISGPIPLQPVQTGPHATTVPRANPQLRNAL